MRILSSTVDRQTRIAGIVGSVLVASVLTGGTVAAQDPTPSPEQGSVEITGSGPDGAPIVISSGSIQALPAGFPGPGCAGMVTVTVGADSTQQVVQGDPGVGCDEVRVLDGPFGHGTVEPFGPLLHGPGLPGPRGVAIALDGGFSVMADPGRVVTVTSVAGDVVGLETQDGWTRELDTANVVITLDKDTLTAADLSVGDTVRVVQVQNANDTWTITGLEVVLPEVMGTVSDVTETGFTVTEVNGTTTAVTVTDATTWPAAMLGAPAPGLATLKDGDIVVVRGDVNDDGTMAAHSVVLQASFSIGIGDPGMPVPAPLPAPETPEASPAP